MSGIVGSKFNHRGSGLVGSLGTDGQHMLSSGAGKKHVFETVAEAGSDFVRLNTTSSNTGASAYNFDTFDNSTYSQYYVIIDGVTANTAGGTISMRIRDAGGEIAANYYVGWHGYDYATGGYGTTSGRNWNGQEHFMGYGAEPGFLATHLGLITIRFSNISSSSYPMWSYDSVTHNNTGTIQHLVGSGKIAANEDTRGFSIYSGGTCSLGTVITYGLKTS
jgi:hypothetical protein